MGLPRLEEDHPPRTVTPKDRHRRLRRPERRARWPGDDLGQVVRVHWRISQVQLTKIKRAKRGPAASGASE